MKSTNIFLLVFFISYCLALENASDQILSFTFEEQNQNQWKSSTDIEPGKAIRLVCTLNSQSANQFKIARLQTPGEPLQSSVHFDNRQVISELHDLKCSDSGVYVCDNGQGVNQTIELGIFGCEPRLCDAEGSTTVVKSASLNESFEFSICVRGYPDVDVEFTAAPGRDTDIETQQTPDILTPTKNDWKYDVAPDPSKFGEYLVTITKDSISQGDYSAYTVAMYTVHEGSRKQLDYTLVLEPTDKGPPECPTHLEIKNQEAESLTLSWQPGFDGGVPQYFLVYTLLENGEWSLTGNAPSVNYMSLNDLQPGTEYSFKVVAMNTLSPKPSASMCHSTVNGKTAKIENGGSDESSSTVIIIVVSSIGGIVFILACITVFFTFTRKNSVPARIYKSLLHPEDRRTSNAEEGRPALVHS